MMNTRELIDSLREENCPLPLYWSWAKDNKPVFLQTLLRDLKNRRATFLADDEGQKNIVKLFYHKQGISHARREIKGLALLQKCEVATSQVLHCSVLGEGVLLILSYLQETRPLSSCWPKLSEPEKKETLALLLIELQKLYQKGVYQNDLHLNNILLDGKQLYIVDGMDVRKHRMASLSAPLNNLALLFLQFSFSDQTLLWQALKKSKISFSPSKLKKCIVAQSLYQQRKMKAKVWRDCSNFVIGQLDDYQYSVVREEKAALIELFHHLTEQESYFTPLKQGKTNTVWHYQCENRNWVVKRYNIKSFWHGLGRSFRMTRAALSWQNANQLKFVHILTAKPIGILQKKWGSWRRQAYFVMEYLQGQSLKNYLESIVKDVQQQEQMMMSVVHVLGALKQNRLCHGDLKVDNWWVCDNKLYLLDLDSLKTHRSALLFEHAFKRDIKRFLRNWQDTPALQQAFMKIFKENQLL